MVLGIRQQLSSFLCNLKSWRTRRRIVVIESDDWGGIRMPSLAALKSLETRGINLSNSTYNLRDCLECGSDLDNLLNVLAASRDCSGKPAIFTTFNVLANPDFDKIRESEFREYRFETCFESYLRYSGEDLRSTWDAAVAEGLFRPQFHAREHLNTPLWLEDLRSGHRETRLCFDQGFFGNQRSADSPRFYMAAYWARSLEHLESIRQAIDGGIELFQSAFGYSPTNFVACDYVLPKQIEEHIVSRGFRGIQTQRGYRSPCPVSLKDKFVYRHTGYRNPWGGTFIVRNVSFEPSLSNDEDHVGRTISEIRTAFRLNCPAVISTHRINYVSGIDRNNGGTTLRLLEQLLRRIRTEWPEVEFISSPQLLELIQQSREDH